MIYGKGVASLMIRCWKGMRALELYDDKVMSICSVVLLDEEIRGYMENAGIKIAF